MSQLPARSRRRGPLENLSPREREVLSPLAEGRSNGAIASQLVITEPALEKHVGVDLQKLRLPPDSGDRRRVLAVPEQLGSA